MRGGVVMKSREVVHLFLLTLLVGGISTAFLSFFTRWSEYIAIIRTGEIIQFISLFVWFMCVGFMFSLISQMGFFVYLTIHRLGIEFFKSKRLWEIVQIILSIVAVSDFLFFQTLIVSTRTMNEQVMVVVALVTLSIVVAYLKVLQTNKDAFVSSVFFMTVITLIEWIPAIQADNNRDWFYFMLIPLLICNGYQLFMLHYMKKRNYPLLSNPV